MIALLALGSLVFPVTQTQARGRSHYGYNPNRRSHRKQLGPPYEAIQSVNTSAGTVTIVPKNGVSHTPKTLRITPDTVVTISGQRSTVQQLQPGMKVNVGLGADADAAAELNASPAPRK
jgi:hypothetical protein